MPECQLVFVVVIDHKYGKNYYVSATEEGANKLVAEYARAWWGDIVKVSSDVPKEPPADDEECVRVYFEAMDGREFFEIQSCEIR